MLYTLYTMLDLSNDHKNIFKSSYPLKFHAVHQCKAQTEIWLSPEPHLAFPDFHLTFTWPPDHHLIFPRPLYNLHISSFQLKKSCMVGGTAGYMVDQPITD